MNEWLVLDNRQRRICCSALFKEIKKGREKTWCTQQKHPKSYRYYTQCRVFICHFVFFFLFVGCNFASFHITNQKKAHYYSFIARTVLIAHVPLNQQTLNYNFDFHISLFVSQSVHRNHKLCVCVCVCQHTIIPIVWNRQN